MDDSQFNIQQALKDISLIRHVLNQSVIHRSDANLAGVALDANIILQLTALLATVALGLVEIVTGNSMTDVLTGGAKNSDLLASGVGLMGTVLIGLVIVLYFILWRAAQHHGEEFNSYVARNFRYVHNLSLISDLLIKFAMLALLMVAGKPQWIAPALLAFTGDFLLQGRFFTLPTKIAAASGAACIAGAFFQYSQGSGLLVVPLVAFAAISGISVIRLLSRYRQQSAASA